MWKSIILIFITLIVISCQRDEVLIEVTNKVELDIKYDDLTDSTTIVTKIE